nr:ABC transporter permease [Inmirania thermothiophila]
MGWQPVLLWTDALVWGLALAVLGLALGLRRSGAARETWGRIVGRPLGAASAVVLAAYAGVGLADSVHLRGPDGAVLSVLDLALTPLRTHVEKTYSAPFALRQLSGEMVQRPDGRVERVRPRLRFGGAHLRDEAGRAADIARRGGLGAAAGLAAGALALLPAAWAQRGRRWSAAARAGAATWLALGVLAGAVAALAPHYHVLGTDKVGEDVLYQALKGVRTGLVIGTLTTLVMLPFAVALGTAAGYFGGRVDDLVQYTYTTLSSIPGVLLIAAAVLMLQVYMGTHPEAFPTNEARADARLLFLCVILGVTSWTHLCRLLRGEALKLRELDYVAAARAQGAGHLRILARHVVPNVWHIVLITVVLDFSGLVLAEAVLSYVGVGVDPTMESWGNMINGARLELAREPVVWWSLAASFLFMFGLVLAANVFADHVRDALDPRLRAGLAGGSG